MLHCEALILLSSWSLVGGSGAKGYNGRRHRCIEGDEWCCMVTVFLSECSRGDLCHFHILPGSMCFILTLLSSSHISPQHLCYFHSNYGACTRQLCRCSTSFVISVVSVVGTPVIVISSLTSWLRQGWGKW